jgi:hypothetical protein
MSQPRRARGKDPLAFGPALTFDQVQAHEARTDISLHRRVSLAILTRGGQELLKGFGSDADTLLETIDLVTAHRDHMQSSLKLADAALARLLIVGTAMAKGECHA